MEDKNLPADFRLYVNVCRNRKTRRMIRDLGVESFYSLVALWCYATENCPDGNLGDPSTSNFATDLADACYWPEDRADEWIAYLVKARWLDAKDGHLLVHDWMLMQPWLSTRLSRSLAGKKGGLKAAAKMTDAQLAERAKRAADARWNKASDAKQMLSDAKQHAKPHPNPSHPTPEEIEESPGELNSPAPPPKQNALRHVSLNETTWEFEGVTDEDRANWSKAAPAIDHDREIAKAINWLQAHPGKLAARRKGGRWVVFLNSWMTKAQEYAESRVAVAMPTQARPAGNMNSGSPAPTPRPQPAPIGQQAQVRQRPKVRRQVTDWEQVKAVLKPEISERAFAKFIQTAKYLGETDEPPCLVLHCADKYSADYIFHNLRWQLVGAVKAVTGQDLGVVVDWDEEQAA